jgi:diguanylate cyclase (GGDEF)-like protein
LSIKKYLDLVTGLPTGSQLALDLDGQSPTNSKHAYTLIQISIDNYEEINEYFGVDISNLLLKQLSAYLFEHLPNKRSKLYRFQLDKFSIFSTSRIDLKDLNYYIKKLIHKITNNIFLVNGECYNISVSIGIARGRDNLLKRAFLALSSAKKLEKSYTIYNHNSNIEEKFLKNIKIYQEIKDAIQDDRVVPFFQPIYDPRVGKVVKYEALMRIRNSDGTYKAPSEFLDIAKKTKLYFHLTKKMIRASLLKASIMKQHITINLSIADIENQNISKFIYNSVNKFNIGDLITFEIVETSAINSFIKVSNFIHKLRELGCKFALDDFGSGYANFEHILKLDVDYVKIDGSLIKNIDNNHKNVLFLKTIVNFTKELKIKTVAEYVSSKYIYDRVNLLGVDLVQGYYIGRPKNLLAM